MNQLSKEHLSWLTFQEKGILLSLIFNELEPSDYDTGFVYLALTKMRDLHLVDRVDKVWIPLVTLDNTVTLDVTDNRQELTGLIREVVKQVLSITNPGQPSKYQAFKKLHKEEWQGFLTYLKNETTKHYKVPVRDWDDWLAKVAGDGTPRYAKEWERYQIHQRRTAKVADNLKSSLSSDDIRNPTPTPEYYGLVTWYLKTYRGIDISVDKTEAFLTGKLVESLGLDITPLSVANDIKQLPDHALKEYDSFHRQQGN